MAAWLPMAAHRTRSSAAYRLNTAAMGPPVLAPITMPHITAPSLLLLLSAHPLCTVDASTRQRTPGLSTLSSRLLHLRSQSCCRCLLLGNSSTSRHVLEQLLHAADGGMVSGALGSIAWYTEATNDVTRAWQMADCAGQQGLSLQQEKEKMQGVS